MPQLKNKKRPTTPWSSLSSPTLHLLQTSNKSANNSTHKNKMKNDEYKCLKNCMKCNCRDCSGECLDYIKHQIYGDSPLCLRSFHFMTDLVLFGIGMFYVLLCPFTKVEESFNMQASHDMLFNGFFNIQSYDHLLFPGVVPRTFVGSLLLSVMIYPWKFVMTYIMPLFFSFEVIFTQISCQYLIRASLLAINICALSKFRQSFTQTYIIGVDGQQSISQKSSNKIYNKARMIRTFNILFAILITAQFHYLFYSSRLLPNCFALPCVTIAFAHYFRMNYHKSVQWLAASTILFRCDTIVIAFPFILVMLSRIYIEESTCYKKLRVFAYFILCGVMASAFCISLTILVDSWYWNGYSAWKWPEFEVLWYNTVENNSVNWGVSPWRYYFFPLIPKMLLINIVFQMFSSFRASPYLFVKQVFSKPLSEFDICEFRNLCKFFMDLECILLQLICTAFVFLYSFLPHKESRFVFFIIPPFTLLSTIGCIRLLTLWGMKEVRNPSNLTLSYYRSSLYNLQKQYFFIYIPHNSLLQSIINKLSSFDGHKALSVKGIRHYLKKVINVCKLLFNQTRMHFMNYLRNKKHSVLFKDLCIPLFICVTILLSMAIAFYGVLVSAYNYPGGVAITLFPHIINDHNHNIAMMNMMNQMNDNNNNNYTVLYDEDGNAYHMSYDQYGNPIDFNNEESSKTPTQETETHENNENNDNNANNDEDGSDGQEQQQPYNNNNYKQNNYQKQNQHRAEPRRRSSRSSRYRDDAAYQIVNQSMPNANNEQNENGKSKTVNKFEKQFDAHAGDSVKNDLIDFYENINCVHIGNLAAQSGVTRFLTPSLYTQYRFAKTQTLEMNDYASEHDPCNLLQEITQKACKVVDTNVGSDAKMVSDDDMYDDDGDYFNDRDDYLNYENENLNVQLDNDYTEMECSSQISDHFMKKGYDYLISEQFEVPGFELVPRGVIYAKNQFSRFSHFFKFQLNNEDYESDGFLSPTLFILKRT